MTDSSISTRAPDASWWDFSIDPAVRDDIEARCLADSSDVPSEEAFEAPEQSGIDYPGYLRLDQLLSAQVPASRVPDERVFVITHQLFELVFKQMIFDLSVVARTLQALLDADDEALRERALEPLPDELGPSAFWRPAMTAAGRLRHAARRVLPSIMTFMGRSEIDDVLFSTLEYERFRDFLAPASGFQTAQLRLIQRALGKSAVLGVHVFPGDVFGQHYTGCPVGHVALGDPLVLRSGHSRAFPEEHTPAHAVAELDETAHAVLARLAPLADGLSAPPSVRTVHPEEVERAVARFRATLGDESEAEAAVVRFSGEMEATAREENVRRGALEEARRGAQALHARHRRSCLAFVLDRIAATDAALHAPDADSWLTVHRKTVRRHVAGDSGTGGGGMPYLVTSQRFLLPLFPALVAYTDLGTAGTDEDGGRW